MLGLKLNHVSKRGPVRQTSISFGTTVIEFRYILVAVDFYKGLDNDFVGQPVKFLAYIFRAYIDA